MTIFLLSGIIYFLYLYQIIFHECQNNGSLFLDTDAFLF
jgi:hypothetical protein